METLICETHQGVGKVFRPLFVLHGDPAFQERVRLAGGRRFECQVVSGWESLREAIRAAPPSAMVLVDPYAEVRESRHLAPQLGALLRQFPSLTVVAALEVGPDCFEHVRMLGAWGVVQVISLDEENTATAIAQRLQAAQGRPLRSLLEGSLPPTTSGYARAILAAAVDVVSVGGQARDLARSFHITARTLLRWCERARLPPPRRLLAWMRILLAAELLDDPGRTVLDVASACGYASDAGLRKVTQTFLGVSPKILRRNGAFGTAAEAFLTELAAVRQAT